MHIRRRDLRSALAPVHVDLGPNPDVVGNVYARLDREPNAGNKQTFAVPKAASLLRKPSPQQKSLKPKLMMTRKAKTKNGWQLSK